MVVAGIQCAPDKPRVISEVKKTSLSKQRLTFSNSYESNRPKISGELLWSATPTQWHVKFAEVRCGSLFVYCSDTGVAEFRLPLHHLNLQSSRTPRTFTLAAVQGIPLATFQTLTEEEYQRWVTVLAVEVLRQTPIHDVRFLDIIGITRGDNGLRRGRSEECLSAISWDNSEKNHKPARNKYNFREEGKKKREKAEFSQWLHCIKRETEEEHRRKNTDFDMKNMKIRRAQKVRPKLPFGDTWKQNRRENYEPNRIPKNKSISMEELPTTREDPLVEPSRCTCIGEKKEVSDESGISSGDENNNTISDSSTKSQSPPIDSCTYVSVREKKKFFESLSGDGKPRKVEVNLNRSSSIGNVGMDLTVQSDFTLKRGLRTMSMHDLSGAPTSTNSNPVKEMRRFFEGQKKHQDFAKSCENLSIESSSRDINKTMTKGNMKSHRPLLRTLDVSKSLEDIAENPQKEENVLIKPVERKAKESVNYANIQFCRKDEKKSVQFSQENLDSCWKQPIADAESKRLSIREEEGPEGGISALLTQRKLQRGERKLAKLRIQIADVEDTNKMIAEDLQSIGPDTLKRRKGLEVFAALRRRFDEETSRLERLQEETAKVIAENHRTILKMGPGKICR